MTQHNQALAAHNQAQTSEVTEDQIPNYLCSAQPHWKTVDRAPC
ncbi:hypothetical protein S7335_2906 [Synechococcus sp. PCC 7335]|nr:hypothetical protein S7335_2906 [Synechococcus sp. PCC 7335]